MESAAKTNALSSGPKAVKTTEKPLNSNPFAKGEAVRNRLQIGPELFAAAREKFPVQWPNYYLNLLGAEPQTDPIARMGLPTASELVTQADDLWDPVSDQLLRPIPYVVRKHKDRVILLVTATCHFYCRFCFRRDAKPQGSGIPSQEDWRRILTYLKAHPEIEEPILSGGDPFTLSDRKIVTIKNQLLEIPSLKRWRIHSRAPVHFPQRITESLVASLGSPLPLRLVTHFNHPNEITAESRRIAGLMAKYQIEFKNQAVLLAGVNDNLESQLGLWDGLNELGILPHYLHHPDRVSGNARFRITIAQGLDLFERLTAKAKGPLPRYVLDLPDGRGKIEVKNLKKVGPRQYCYCHGDGTRSQYEDIREPVKYSDPRI